MNFLPISYLITIANLQNLVKVAGPLKETSIHLGTLDELSTELVRHSEFPLDGFRENGIQKKGDLAVYISKALQAYIFENRGNPDDEGVIIYLLYGENADVTKNNIPNTLSYFIHGKEVTEDVKKEINKNIIQISKGGVKGRVTDTQKSSLLSALKP